jgi:hypothetical protein
MRDPKQPHPLPPLSIGMFPMGRVWGWGISIHAFSGVTQTGIDKQAVQHFMLTANFFYRVSNIIEFGEIT